MRPEQPRVQSDAADPCGDEAGILACCHVAVRTATAGEQELAGPFAGGPQVIIDRLAGLLAQFKSDGPPGFPLSDGCAIRRISARGDILDSMATTSQPRSLLSIARLNMARSRAWPSI